ncbi:MAG TPA: type II toxin-antitoxin system RelE/ParE family toxin [Steroidobacteraceae bacterium]
MKSYSVVFAPEAEEQLARLYHYIAADSSPEIALRYTTAIVHFCQGLDTFPERGTRRDDIRPGLRVTNYKHRSVIAFVVESEQVSILGVFYGGQDYETALSDP